MAQIPHKTSASDITREALIRAAERLFAEGGIDGVSLRQINLAAGQKNSSAAHYHFGSKESLIMSIFENRMANVNNRRIKYLEELQAKGQINDVRDIVGAIIQPIVDEINADASGQHYIRFIKQAVGHPTLNIRELWSRDHGSGLMKVFELLTDALPDIPQTILGQRFGLTFEQIVHALGDQKSLLGTGERGYRVAGDLFVSNLIDTTTGALAVPVSEKTKALIANGADQQASAA